MYPLLPFWIYLNANLKPQMLAFPSNRTSIDIPLLLSLVLVSALLRSDLYISFYFLSQLEIFYAVFQLGLTSLETDRQALRGEQITPVPLVEVRNYIDQLWQTPIASSIPMRSRVAYLKMFLNYIT